MSPTPDLYLWDHWTTLHAGLLHRFSLAAPRSLTPDERHLRAEIHHFTSANGETWTHRGRALGPGPPGSFDDQATWSGSAVSAGGRLWLFYTGVAAGQELRQTMSFAVSDDGEHFQKLGRSILPPDATPGYDLGADDVLPAWRDPHVVRNPRDGSWHLLFAAKHADRSPRGAIGHAIATDTTFEHWRLLPPLDLPASYLQMECPSLVFRDDGIYLFAVTKDRLDPDESTANIALRAYRATDLGGPWTPAGQAGDDLVLGAEAKIYAVGLCDLPGRGVHAAGFYTRHHPEAYTWTPFMKVAWMEGRITMIENPNGTTFGRKAQRGSKTR